MRGRTAVRDRAKISSNVDGIWGDGGLSHRTSRGGGYGRETGIIDLGHEPPLSVDGSEAAVIDRRRVSVQWFSGTILTGLCGAALIGGAVFASLDGEMTFAKVPERVEGALRGAFGANDKTASLHKSDRLPPPGESTAARNVVRVSTVTRVGNRDVMRVRPFIRISGNLSMTTSDLSAKIPPFNAQRMLSDVGAPRPRSHRRCEQPPMPPNPMPRSPSSPRISAPILPKAKLAAVVALDEVLMRVRDASNWRGNSGVRYAALANATADASGAQPDLKLAYAAEGNAADPYAGFETRVVPENVTLLPKTKDQVTGGNPSGERVHLVKKGDTVTSILRDQGATPEEAKAIAATLGARGRDGGLKEGEKLRILMAPAGPARPAAAALPGDRRQRFRRRGRRRTVRSRQIRRRRRAEHEHRHRNRRQAATTTTMTTAPGYGSIKASTRPRCATRCRRASSRTWSASTPTTSISSARCSPAIPSTCSLPARTKAPPSPKRPRCCSPRSPSAARPRNITGSRPPTIRWSTTTTRPARARRSSWSASPSTTPSCDRASAAAAIRSSATSRCTPASTGPRAYGTPIFASGNGVVETAGWEGGYGNYVKLKHNNGYETAYGHMSAFAKGLEPGKRVRQGQVIGFVGSTGQSTGAHVHYEILVNGRFVDPMRIKLPRGRSLDGPLMASFEKERDRLDAMMSNRGGAARMSDAAGGTGVRQVSNR